MNRLPYTHTSNSQSGFTLIELAIVLVIVGLLVGGILKGQELIANAQLKATISQIEAIKTAVVAFEDKYGALPGDLSGAATKIAGCTTTLCGTVGNGNGKIGAAPTIGGTLADTTEGFYALAQLGASELLSGLDTSFGGFPSSKMGGGFWIDYSDGTPVEVAAGRTTAPAGNYIVFAGDTASTVGGAPGPLSTNEAARIDRQLDDGNPDTGSILGAGADTKCRGTGAYDESDQTSTCALYIKLN